MMRPAEKIYSKNAAYQRFETLKTNRNKRYKQRAFWLEGVRNLNAAIRYGWQIESLLFAGETNLSPWAREKLAQTPTEINYQLAPQLLAELSEKKDTSELLAVVRMRDDDPDAVSLPGVPLLALFDRPSNHGNLGTILRSCDALGVDALILTGHGVDVYDPDVVTASMGSFFRVPTLRLSDNAAIERYLAALRARHPGFQVVGTSAHGEKTIYDTRLDGPLLLMLGNETEGLNRHFMELCDVLVTIPMDDASEATSLNVACAASVLFAEAGRQRRGRGAAESLLK